MISVHSVDGFQSDLNGWYCYLEDETGNQVATIEIDDRIAHCYLTRSDINTEFDFNGFEKDDDDLIDYVNEALFLSVNWIVDTKLINQLIEVVFQDQ